MDLSLAIALQRAWQAAVAAACTALLGGRASEAAAHRSLAEAGLEAGWRLLGLVSCPALLHPLLAFNQFCPPSIK